MNRNYGVARPPHRSLMLLPSYQLGEKSKALTILYRGHFSVMVAVNTLTDEIMSPLEQTASSCTVCYKSSGFLKSSVPQQQHKLSGPSISPL